MSGGLSARERRWLVECLEFAYHDGGPLGQVVDPLSIAEQFELGAELAVGADVDPQTLRNLDAIAADAEHRGTAWNATPVAHGEGVWLH